MFSLFLIFNQRIWPLYMLFKIDINVPTVYLLAKGSLRPFSLDDTGENTKVK